MRINYDLTEVAVETQLLMLLFSKSAAEEAYALAVVTIPCSSTLSNYNWGMYDFDRFLLLCSPGVMTCALLHELLRPTCLIGKMKTNEPIIIIYRNDVSKSRRPDIDLVFAIYISCIREKLGLTR